MVHTDPIASHYRSTPKLQTDDRGKSKQRFANFLCVALALILAVSTVANAQEAMPNFATFPTGWITDRYEPASMANVGSYQGRTNVIGIGINSTTDSANRPVGQQGTFYNTQGRKYTFSPRIVPGKTVSAELYIPAAWANGASGTVRSDLWGTLVDASDVVSAYAIFGFTNFDGAPRYRLYDSTSGLWVNLALPVQYDSWTRFSFRLESDGTINYFVNGTHVHSDMDSNGSASIKEAMLQAYNFADPAIAPPAASTAAYTAHWSQFSPATSRIVVTPTNTFGWSTADTRPGGATNFLADSTGPAGAAALNLTTTASVAAKAQYMHSASTPLADVTELSYLSKQNSAAFAQGAVSYQMAVYLNGTPASFTTLVYEPYNNFPSPIVNGTWQLWDVDAGTFWSSRSVTAGGACNVTAGGGGPPFYSLSQLKANCPNAVVSAFGVNVGSNNPSYDVETDLVNFNGTEYDFELVGGPTLVVDFDGVASTTDCNAAGSPYATITAAVAAAPPGATIRVCPGTYNENPAISKTLTLQAVGGRDVTTIALPITTDNPYGPLFLIGNGNDITIDGFTILGNDGTATTAGNTNIVVGTELSSVVVKNNRIRVGKEDFKPDFDSSMGLLTTYLTDRSKYVGSVTVENNIFDTLGSGAQRAFYINPGVASFTFNGNTINGGFTGRTVTESDASVISNNVFTGTGTSAGLGVNNGSPTHAGASFTGNTVSNTSIALWLGTYSGAGANTVRGNTFTNNGTGINVPLSAGTTLINFNRIAGNTVSGINAASAVVNAENNWWGCNYGPAASGPGCVGTANGIAGAGAAGVDANPWLTLTTSASPTAIGVGGSSSITSLLTINSSSANTVGLGNIPNGTPASFGGINGTVAPPTASTVAGSVATTYTATSGGSNGATTTVDGQTVTAAVNVTITISGNVSPSLAGVTINLAGSTNASTTTDGSGNYSFSGLPGGGSYLVTPSLGGYTFEPASRSYTNVTTDIANANFNGFVGSSTRIVRMLNSYTTPGQNVTVPVELISQGNENSVAFSINYDPLLLHSPTVTLGPDAGSGFLVVNSSTAGQLGVAVALAPPAVFSSGTRHIVNVTFSTNATAVPNTPVTFGNSPTIRKVANANADPLPATFVGALVVFTQGLEADVVSRPSGDNIVNVADFTQVGRFVVGLDTVDPAYNEFQRADVAPRPTKGDGSLDVTDFTQAGRYAAGLDATTAAGGPLVAAMFPFALSSAKQADVEQMAAPEGSVRIVRVANAISSPSQQVVVSVEIEAQGNEAGVGFTMSYDQSILSNPVVAVGSGMPGAFMIPNTSTDPGKVGVVLTYITGNIVAGTRQIATITFTVSPTAAAGTYPLGLPGAPPTVNSVSSVAPVTNLPATYTGGTLTILGPSAATATAGGIVKGPDGRGVKNAFVSLTDETGEIVTVRTNTFGYFRFEGLTVGRTYVLDAKARGYSFAPMVLNLMENVLDLTLVAEGRR